MDRGMKLAAALISAVVLAGCGGGARVAAERPADVDWRRLATDADRTRLRDWRQAWIEARAKVVVAPGGPAALSRDPALFDADRALAKAVLAVGDYRCRTIKLGPRNLAMTAVSVGGWGPCAVTRDGATTRFATTGVQRADGHLFADTDGRSIFLGTAAFGDETRTMPYGRDARRNMAGIVERIGEGRWRLVLPYPGFESTLDTIEIVAR